MDSDNKQFLLPNEYITIDGQKSHCLMTEVKDNVTLEKKLAVLYIYDSLPLDPNFITLLETNNCKILDFQNEFNHSIDNLPNCIEAIIFPTYSKFNQPINNLPNSLNYLELPQYFNQPIDNLPPNVKTLCIQEFFNQSIDYLPLSLEYLEIHGNFNQPVDNLPSSLKSLIIKDQEITVYNYNSLYSLNSKFNQTLDNLPDNLEYLEYLEVSNMHFIQKINILPQNIKILLLNKEYYLDKIESLESLKQRFPNIKICSNAYI